MQRYPIKKKKKKKKKRKEKVFNDKYLVIVTKYHHQRYHFVTTMVTSRLYMFINFLKKMEETFDADIFSHGRFINCHKRIHERVF